MRDQTCNGWTNYETWLVNVWIDNEEYTQRYWRERADECVKDTAGEFCPDGAAIGQLADEMRDAHDEAVEGMVTAPGIFGDLLNAALGAVNWDELARHYINEVKDEATA